jgi:hypothetical protein
MEPKTKQYGSHMVMSNVRKTPKTKYINIDTRFRDEYNYSQLINYNVTIPERITDVKSMRAVCAEIPISFYNISLAFGNSYFKITDTNNTTKIITIPDGQYSTKTQLISAITTQISANYPNLSCTLNTTTLASTIFTALNSKIITLNFAVNADGTNDKFNFKTKLGWLLGFRNPTYTINATAPITYVQSEALIDTNGPRYLYLAIDEFSKGNQSSFIPTLFSSIVNKNIIARIALDNANHGFGQILPVNNYNGLLTSDIRNYTGKIDLLKLNIQLLNENGNVVNLNGMDFSFCLEIVHE